MKLFYIEDTEFYKIYHVLGFKFARKKNIEIDDAESFLSEKDQEKLKLFELHYDWYDK